MLMWDHVVKAPAYFTTVKLSDFQKLIPDAM
jgi:hypothetical protein